MATIGIDSAAELVRLHTPFDVAVGALVHNLGITRDEAVAAMHAAHEHADWGFERAPSGAGRGLIGRLRP